MILKELVSTHHWLSVAMTLEQLYPDQASELELYREVFDKLRNLPPKPSDMLIVLTEYESDGDDESVIRTYVDVSGRKQENAPHALSNSYAIEFVEWRQWMGMEVAPETLRQFGPLAIIAHCLHEMTVFGYDEASIVDQFKEITDCIDDYKRQSSNENEDEIGEDGL
jgi:hypothetical protein